RHARSKSDWVVRVEAHHERGSSRGDAGRENNALGGHPCLWKNLWIHDDDVRHRHESRQPLQPLLPHWRMVFRNLEVTIEQNSPPASSDRASSCIRSLEGDPM